MEKFIVGIVLPRNRDLVGIISGPPLITENPTSN